METRELTSCATPDVMNADSFDEVLRAARNGDGGAFAVLYELMNRRVHAFVSYRGATDPEAMVSDVFVKVFTNLNDFEGNAVQFAAWVFQIARNTLIDESRARKRRPTETVLDRRDEPHRSHGDVELDALGGMGTAWVLEMLEPLTPEQRDVVVMRVVSDLTIEAIAELLGKRVGAVKALQRRALRTIARNLDKAVPK